MPIMKQPFEQLKEKLKEIFQLDRSDLDFGIYRILNIKSAEINNFLDNDLLSQVNDVLDEHQGKDVATLQADLEWAISGAEAAGVDPANAPKVQAINKKIALLGGNIDERAKVVFSDLYNFFRRYYKDGDFLSLRRYKKDVYALPYEGEEVKLHWANADQYYVKSSEKFGRYVFRAGDKRITLEIAAADTERDNNKANGKTLRYLPLPNEEDELFTIQGAQMNIRFACTATNDQRRQENINEDTARKLLDQMPAEWRVMLKQLAPTKKNGARCLLHKHINTFTAKNTFDYFIHKDLRGFLRRELDFYIKNEVMLLDDIEETDAPTADVWLGRAFALRKVGHKIIDFLAQMENFQKRIWLKKKFVLQTHYCAALGHLPLATMPKLLARILDNETQWAEWESLGIVRNSDFAGGDAQQKREEFLRQNPSLPVDTRHFDKNFQYELLAGYDNLDEFCDGMLIHGENFHALNLLRGKYQKKMQCVHIDPPYNATTNGFMYKNGFQHSSWMAMIENRATIAFDFLDDKGVFQCHIDENEFSRLSILISNVTGDDSEVIIWDKTHPLGGGGKIATCHEYIAIVRMGNVKLYKKRELAEDVVRKADSIVKKYGGDVNINACDEFFDWLKKRKFLEGEEQFRYLDKEGAYQTVHMGAPEKRTSEKFFIPIIHPITQKPCPVPASGWSNTPEFMQGLLEKGLIDFGPDEKTQPRRKVYLKDNLVTELSTIIVEGSKGKVDISKLGIDFPYCHPVRLYKKLLFCNMNKNSHILDYFAGSGTTAHAAIDLNREDGGQRKFILVEMGEYFSTVLLPRIKKVMYAPEWKDGKPKQKATDEEFEYGPRLIKYQCIESYEDALDNLQDKPPDAPRAKESFANQAMREDYMLHYFLDVETKDSASLLNVESMVAYDKYHLHITREGKTEKMPVDLVETFNYLLGLRVAKMRYEREVLMIKGQNPQGDNVLVIWRDANTMSAEQLNEWFRTVEINLHNNEYDIIYINGDNLVESLRLSEEVWKVRSTEKEFRRLMFEDTD